MTDIYTSIREDHDAARELMAQIMDTTNRAEKKREELFDTFKRELWAHNKIEEAVFYSELLERKKTEGEAMEAMSEHHSANSLIEELDTMPKDNQAWISKFSALKELLEHHMEEEEEEVFSDARSVLNEKRAEELGNRFKARKTVVVPALEPVER